MKPSNKLLATTLTTLVVALAGCSTARQSTDASAHKMASGDAALKSRVMQYETENAKLKQQLATVSASANSGAAGGNGLYPANARPGECYAQTYEAPTYKTVSEKVVAEEAGERVEIIPATYRTVTEKVIVEEASTRLEVVPATYKTVQERVAVKPEVRRLVAIPATYGTVTERVLDQPARTEWKRSRLVDGQYQPANGASNGYNGVTRIDSSGEVVCLVEIPATYRTITKRVLKTPAGTREAVEPAQYSTVTKRVVATPAATREVTIPAKYKTITRQVEVTPASTRKIATPARYETVSRKVKVSEGRTAFYSVLCEVNATPDRIRSIQAALQKRGHYKGALDGRLGNGTANAVRSYQSSAGLPSNGLLTIDTVKSLGLS